MSGAVLQVRAWALLFAGSGSNRAYTSSKFFSEASALRTWTIFGMSSDSWSIDSSIQQRFRLYDKL